MTDKTAGKVFVLSATLPLIRRIHRVLMIGATRSLLPSPPLRRDRPLSNSRQLGG